MRTATMSLFMVASLVLLPDVGLGQTRMPDTNTFAAGADIGIFAPSDDQFDSSVLVGGLGEMYVTRRISFRGSLFWTDPQFSRGTDDSMRQIRLGMDVLYNWEAGTWHPFVGGGLGVHFLKLLENDNEIVSDKKAGLAMLGGLEYFIGARVAVKGELRYHFVGDFAGTDPSGLGVTVGLKGYF